MKQKLKFEKEKEDPENPENEENQLLAEKSGKPQHFSVEVVLGGIQLISLNWEW